MRIYVSASYLRLEEAQQMALRLQTLGHVIHARWLLDPLGIPYVQSAEKMQRQAKEDIADVLRVDAIVCLTGDPPELRSRGGKHVEFGVALATGKRCFIVGPMEHVFHWHEAVRVCRDMDHLAELLAA